MTVEDCRIILRVHIRAAESCGKTEASMALLEVFTAIDYEMAAEVRRNKNAATVDALTD